MKEINDVIEEAYVAFPVILGICKETSKMNKKELTITLAMQIDTWCAEHDGDYEDILKRLTDAVRTINDAYGKMKREDNQ